MKLPTGTSESLSIMRAFAMVSIILCHYVHWIERIAWVGQFLNVGVPVFFLISGFLYGHKNISDFKTWFIQRYLKIMIPIWVYCLVTTFVLGIIGKLGMPKPLGTLITILGCQGVISGGGGIGNVVVGHLWFISFILLSYGITPLLQMFITRLEIREFFILLILSLLILNSYVLFIPNPGMWVWLPGCLVYVVGYYLGKYHIQSYTHMKKLLLVCANIGIILICIAIRLLAKHLLDSPQNTLSSQCYSRVIAIDTHCCLAIAFFVIALLALQQFNRLRKRLFGLTKILSDYSFEIYIVHYMFLTGVLSCSNITSNIFLNTFFAISIIIISTMFLKTLAKLPKRLLTNA